MGVLCSPDMPCWGKSWVSLAVTGILADAQGSGGRITNPRGAYILDHRSLEPVPQTLVAILCSYNIDPSQLDGPHLCVYSWDVQYVSAGIVECFCRIVLAVMIDWGADTFLQRNMKRDSFACRKFQTYGG